jgi:hypothetical protein
VDPLTDLHRARNDLVAYVGGGLGTVLVVVLLPKDPAAQILRLGYTLLFFGGLLTALSALVGPLARFLDARIDLAWQDAGDEVRSLQHAMADRIDRYVRALGYWLLAVTTLLLCRVLSAWPIGAPLAPFAGILTLAFWLSVAGVLVHFALTTNRLTEIALLRRAARRQAELGHWHALSEAEMAEREARLAGPAVVVTGLLSFDAGGMSWHWSDFQKNAIVFGQTGSGKTVTVLNALLDGLLSSAGSDRQTAAAALILDPKGDYRSKIERLARRLGRDRDLCILDPARPDASVRWNPLDSPDDALEVAGRFGAVLALLGMKATQDTFFIDSAKVFMRHAIGLLRAVEPHGEPPSFARVAALVSQPALVKAEAVLYLLRCALPEFGQSVGEETLSRLLRDERELAALAGRLDRTRRDHVLLRTYLDRWRDDGEGDWEACRQLALARAGDAAACGAERLMPGREAALAVEYLFDTWLPMPERTRGSVQSQLILMLDPFLVEPYRSVFSGRSTVSMAQVLDRGLLFYSFMPAEDKPEMSRLINTLLKLDYYRQVLLHVDKARPSLFFCDEFQAFFTSDEGRGDAPFFSRSRQSLHANVVATQNYGGLLAEARKPEIVRNFLGNCAIKLFLRNTEGETNEFASKDVFGEYSALVVNLSESGGARGGREGLRSSGSLGEQLQRARRVPAERFAGLGIPDRTNGRDYAEAMVHLGSRAEVAMGRLRFKVHALDG